MSKLLKVNLTEGRVEEAGLSDNVEVGLLSAKRLEVDVTTAAYKFSVDVHAGTSFYNSLAMNNDHTDAGRIGLVGGGWGGGADDHNLYVDAVNRINFRNQGTIIGSLQSNGCFRVGSDASAQAVLDVNNTATNALTMRVDRPTTTAYDVIAAFVSDVTTTDSTKCVIRADGDLENVNNAYGAYSDRKLKKNIHDATPKLDKLMRVIVRSFSLKADPDFKQIGVVAQELEEVFPGLVTESPDYETVPDPDWVPAPAEYRERQAVDLLQEEEAYLDLSCVDGVWRQEVKTKVKEIRKPRTEMQTVVVVAKDGKERSVEMQVPVMERFLVQEAQTEADRPTITRPTGTVTKAVKYSVFVPILIKAMQELHDQCTTLHPSN